MNKVILTPIGETQSVVNPEEHKTRQELLNQVKSVENLKADVRGRTLVHIINGAVRKAFSGSKQKEIE